MKEKLKQLPQKPGVYIFKAENGKIIYIGKAKNLKKRVSQYFNRSNYKNVLILSKAEDIEFFLTNNEVEALLLEYSLIKKHKPEFNIQLKDDKSYPYVFLDLSEEFPGIYFMRKKQQGKKEYFGPYPSASSVRKIIGIVEKYFKLKTCKTDFSKITRPCLKYQIARCAAPCVKPEIKKDYLENVKMAKNFLEGKLKKLEKEIEEKMAEASENLEFEKAAKLRDTLFALKKFREKQAVFIDMPDTDFIFHKEENWHFVLILYLRGNRIVDKKELFFEKDKFESTQNFMEMYIASLKDRVPAIFTNFEIENKKILEEAYTVRFKEKVEIKNISKKGKYKKLVEIAEKNLNYIIGEKEKQSKSLEKLKDYLKLEKTPDTIYGFDISHLGGCFTVASSVCFKNGKPEKSFYRRIKLEEGINDDYKSIYLAVKKRLESDKKRGIPLPDLIVIDGGKGQLNSALKAIKELKLESRVDLISIAKKEEIVFSKNFPERIKLDFSLPFASLITKVRNESHRFANEYRKKLYRKKNLNSILLEIPGIGQKTYQKLIKEFKSVEGIKSVSLEDLEKITNKKTAERIKKFLNDFKN